MGFRPSGALAKQTRKLKSGRHPPPPASVDSTMPSLCLNPAGIFPQAQPGGPGRTCATLPAGKTHPQLPWLERMGWGREAEVGATLGGEPLGRTQGVAESRESSMI